MNRPPEGAAGVSLIEALVALVLGLFVVHLGFTALIRLDRSVSVANRRAEVSLSVRIARTVLSTELAHGERGRDWWVGRDTLALRAFRGAGVVCPGSVSGRGVRVTYRGSREPDPRKDSLEVTSDDGSLLIVGLAGATVSEAPCTVATESEIVQDWVAAGDLPTGAVVVRPFERGSYHLSGSALRYRAARGGRQPLTPEVLLDGASWFADSVETVVARLTPVDGSRPWTVVLWRGDP